MSNSETFCELIARRRAILNNRKAPIRLEIDNPYTNSDGSRKTNASGAEITPYMIYERRKAEILQYNHTYSVNGILTRAQQYKQTVENVGQTSNKVVENADGTTTTFGISTCLSDLYLPTSSSAAGIPGPSFAIQYRQDVPLYGYAANTLPIGISNTDSMNAWDFNTGTNIQAINGEWTTLVRIFHNVDNIDSEQVNKDYTFNMYVPIGLYVAGDISGVFAQDNSSNHIFISNIEVKIINHTGTGVVGVESPNVTNYFNDISMNYIIKNQDNFKAIQYMGNLPLNITLPIQTLSYYEIQLKFDIIKEDNNEYESFSGVDSYVSAAYMNLTENNIDFSNNIHSVGLISGGDLIVPTTTNTGFTIMGIAQD
jgi:hypothetical protein